MGFTGFSLSVRDEYNNKHDFEDADQRLSTIYVRFQHIKQATKSMLKLQSIFDFKDFLTVHFITINFSSKKNK